MATDILVDALPYFDTGFDEPGVREMVIILKFYFSYFGIQNEIKTINKLSGSCNGR
jgi:hypothetical protein